jgi:Tol biopolymer transport system component
MVAYGPSVVLPTSLRWHDRAGATFGPALAPRAYSSPRLSPDGTSVMVAITDATTALPDLWLLALARGTIARVTSDQSSDWFPAWSHDGARVFFGSGRTGSTAIFQKTGVGSEELVVGADLLASAANYPVDVSPDGNFLLYMQSTSRGYDIGVLALSGDRNPTPFHAGPFNQVQPRFSPNQRWITYASDESGRFEVYVRPFPAADNAQSTTISIAGGMHPEWRRDGKELFLHFSRRQADSRAGRHRGGRLHSRRAAGAVRRRSPGADRSLPQSLHAHRGRSAISRQHRHGSTGAFGVDDRSQLARSARHAGLPMNLSPGSRFRPYEIVSTIGWIRAR